MQQRLSEPLMQNSAQNESKDNAEAKSIKRFVDKIFPHTTHLKECLDAHKRSPFTYQTLLNDLKRIRDELKNEIDIILKDTIKTEQIKTDNKHQDLKCWFTAVTCSIGGALICFNTAAAIACISAGAGSASVAGVTEGTSHYRALTNDIGILEALIKKLEPFLTLHIPPHSSSSVLYPATPTVNNTNEVPPSGRQLTATINMLK